MNIFYLDHSSKKAAELLGDRHIVKMIIESAQMLSTAHRVLDGFQLSKSVYVFNDERDYVFYRSTHVNHPCSIWTRTSSANYTWLYEHFYFMHEEFKKRFKKEHKSFLQLNDVLKILPVKIPIGPLTSPALAMPEKYKFADPVKSYRLYYIKEKIKTGKVQYLKSEFPKEFKEDPMF